MSTLVLPPATLDTNPFVGPRPLRPGEPIFGRDREIRRLTNLLVAERIVLLYSPSGAGKTSLIEAGLLPRLRDRRFQVSPPVRVSLRPPDAVTDANRYLVSTLQSLEAGLRPGSERSARELLDLGLEGYLQEWAAQDNFGTGNEMLVFDQFEEVLVLDPGDDPVKREFFVQLGSALEERGRWALFSMREDYIAGLDPYLAELPTRLHTRMRLDLLSPDSARRAAESLAASGGRTFQEPAVLSLVENLRRVQAQREGELVYVPGPVVEPLQLQVVCRRLWDSLPPDATEMTEADVDRLGRIQDALADYYATQVTGIAAESGVPERVIRDWFGRQLVTEQGVRRQQQHGPGADPAAAERVVRLLEDAHLIRTEARRGTRWLELAHDQLVEPIRENNAGWHLFHLSPLQQRAQQWAALDRPHDLLVTGKVLSEAKSWAAEHPAEVSDLEQSFLRASGGAEADRRRRRRTTVLLRWLAAALAVALVGTGLALRSAETARDEAAERSEEATSRALAAEAAAQVTIDPARALRLAERALSHATTHEAEDALRQALAQTIPAAVLTHGDTVNSVQFNPVGDQVLTASWDRTARIRDAETGEQLRLFPHNENVLDARYSPDGEFVLTLTGSGQLSTWRVDGDSDEPIMTTSEVRWPASFTPDGTRILVADSATNAVKILDPSSGRPALDPLVGHAAAIKSIATSADGAFVLTAGQDGTARVWDGSTGQQVAVLEGTGASAWQAAFREDSGAVAVGYGDGSVRVWRWPDPGQPLVLDGQEHGAASVAFDGAGNVVAYGDKSPRVFDSSSGDLRHELEGHQSWVLGVRPGRDGQRIVSASSDGTVRVWDAPSGQQIAVLRGHEDSSWIQAELDPTGAVVATISGQSVRLFRLPEQRVLPAGQGDWILDVASLPGEEQVVAGGEDGHVRVWDVASGQMVADLTGPGASVQGIDVDPSGRYVAAATHDGTASVWDWRSGELLAQRQLLNIAVEVTFDGDGSRLVVAGNPDVVAWNWVAGAGDEVQTLIYGGMTHSIFQAFAFSPDGTSFATSSTRELEIWSSDGVFQRQLGGHSGHVFDVAYSQDGTHLVTAGADGTARIWTADGEPVRTLEGHRGELWSAAFDDSGDWVVTGGDDGFIGVWEVKTGRRIGWLPRHADTVNTVLFTGGQTPGILSASDDTTVRIAGCETCLPRDDLRSVAGDRLAADQRVDPKIPAVGECFPHSADLGRPVDCDEPHGAEVFAIRTHPGGPDAPFPRDVWGWIREECQGTAYSDYRGMDYLDDLEFLVTAAGPDTSAEWDLGQRTFVCVLFPLDGSMATGSTRHTA
ncbi:WD-40 repeat-containing protein [Blastococcus colisei]|uniref:WD-40 repeat-containing protein n=1 Tax=Blastococcus colisei TaxID=1564162 RepID=A0A543PFQ7_9ACTN|nr:septum formation family protein [Blastococcus colisei]TQN42911.1 WD-40 repeat-containing protein [Blastococcus colisei]